MSDGISDVEEGKDDAVGAPDKGLTIEEEPAIGLVDKKEVDPTRGLEERKES